MSKPKEYRTVVSCAEQLETTFLESSRDIVHFLLREGFVTQEVHDEVLKARSTWTDHQRARELVAGISNKVKLRAQDYHTLLDHLRQSGKYYESIVSILDQEYSRQECTDAELDPTHEHDQEVGTHDHSSTSSTTSPLPPPTKRSKCTVSSSRRVRHKHVKTKKDSGRGRGKRKHAISSSSSASSASSPSRTTTPPTKHSKKTVSGSHKAKHRHGKMRRVKRKQRKRVTSSLSSASSASSPSSDSNSTAVKQPRHKKHSKCTNNAIFRYRKYLKSYYSNYLIVPDDKLSIAPCSQFISLALIQKGAFSRSALYDGMDCFSRSTLHGGVDEIVASKTPLTLDALVTPDSRFVLVEGPPGIGKSTMCWELCREWDTLESLQRFKTVLQLKLRETRVQNANEPNEIFYHRDKKLCQSVVDEVFECEGEGVLLVLDGFDELPASLVSNKSSLIMELLTGACLPKATRLVTSRPSALHYKNIFPNNLRHIEILGFTDEHKSEFADNAFKSEPDVAKHFKTFVTSNPIINSLMYIPVNCAIMAQVFKDIWKSEKPLPKTMTQLYTTLVLVLMKRHMVKGKDFKVLNDLDDLPKEVFSDLMEVSELAYTGLFKDSKIVFTESDVREGFQDLGLLCKTKEMYLLEDAKTSYSFLHLSVQEFLAAWYVLHHRDLIEKVVPKDPIYISLTKQSIWLFLAGLLKYIVTKSDNNISDFSLRCCYEAQDPSVFQLQHISSPSRLTLTNPLDMYIFGYALVHAPIVWSLDVDTSLETLVFSITDWAPANGLVLGSIRTLIAKLSHCSALKDLPKCIRKSMANLEVHDITDPFLSVLIDDVLPNMPCLECAAFKFSEKCLDECLLYKKLKDIPNLKSLYVYFERGITPRGLHELSTFLSNHHTLQQLSVMYGKQASSDIQESVRIQDLVRVAMSCPSLKNFSTNVVYMFHGIPANIEFFLFEIELLHFFLSASRAFDCLCSIVNMGKLLTLKYLYVLFQPYFLGVKLTSKLYSDLLALVRNSLHSNPMLGMRLQDMSHNLNPGTKLHCVSCALRKDPDAVQVKLRRSNSLCDLTGRVHHAQERMYTPTKCQSSPDLLELQALHNIHPNLCTALRVETFDNFQTVKKYFQKEPKIKRGRMLLPVNFDRIPQEYGPTPIIANCLHPLFTTALNLDTSSDFILFPYFEQEF